MSSSKKAFLRRISILESIENNGLVTAKELASEFCVSCRTIVRDINFIREAGIEISYDSWKKKYFSPRHPTRYMPLPSTAWFQLYTVNLLSAFNQDRSRPPWRTLVNHASERLRYSLAMMPRRVLIADQMELTSSLNEFYSNELWRKIATALVDLRKISVSFESTRHSEILEIYGMTFNGEWGVLASSNFGRTRIYKLNEFNKIDLTNEYFELPVSFSVSDYSAWRSKSA